MLQWYLARTDGIETAQENAFKYETLVIILSPTQNALVSLPYPRKTGPALGLCPVRAELKSFIFSSGFLSYITTHFFTYFSDVGLAFFFL